MEGLIFGGAYAKSVGLDCSGRGDLTEVFLRYDFGGLIFGGAYTWRAGLHGGAVFALRLLCDIIPWDACGSPTVKIRFGCTQLCKASQ